MSDPLIRLLTELAQAAPDPARAERIRVRCHTQLARQAPRPSASYVAAAAVTTVQVWRPLAAVLGVAYLTAVIVQALQVYGLR